MKYLTYLISIILLLGINIGLFGILPIQGQIPNLLFLFVLCFALKKNGRDFLFIALFSGIFLDFYSTGFFGGFTLAFPVFASLVHVSTTRILAADVNFKTLGLTAALAWFFLSFTTWLWQLIALKLNLASNYVAFEILAKNFLPSLFYNLLLLYPIYLFYDFLKRLLDRLETRRRGLVK